MLRYRDDVSDCYGVMSPCTSQLRRRHDVNDGGRDGRRLGTSGGQLRLAHDSVRSFHVEAGCFF